MGRVNNREWNGAHILILRKPHLLGKSSRLGVGGAGGRGERGKWLEQLLPREELPQMLAEGSLSTKAPDVPFPGEDLGSASKVDRLLLNPSIHLSTLPIVPVIWAPTLCGKHVREVRIGQVIRFCSSLGAEPESVVSCGTAHTRAVSQARSGHQCIFCGSHICCWRTLTQKNPIRVFKIVLRGIPSKIIIN